MTWYMAQEVPRLCGSWRLDGVIAQETLRKREFGTGGQACRDDSWPKDQFRIKAESVSFPESCRVRRPGSDVLFRISSLEFYFPRVFLVC